MRFRTYHLQKVVIVFSLTATLSPATAQPAQGTLYAIHSNRAGQCPSLDWHITVQGDDLEGFVAWDRGRHMASLEGKLIPASAGRERSFKMDAQEVGGTGRKATVQGTTGGQYINASIEGSGTACDGKILSIPRVVGGLSGGGG